MKLLNWIVFGGPLFGMYIYCLFYNPIPALVIPLGLLWLFGLLTWLDTL